MVGVAGTARAQQVPADNPSPRAGGTAACWDINRSGVCELPGEDLNGDGSCTIADCGVPGRAGGSGNGVDGREDAACLADTARAGLLGRQLNPGWAEVCPEFECWDVDQSGFCEIPDEDVNGDGSCTILDCEIAGAG